MYYLENETIWTHQVLWLENLTLKGTASTCESECAPPLLLYARCPWFLTILIGLRLKPMLRDDSTCMDSQKKYIHYVHEDKSQNNYIYTLCSGIAHGFSKQAHGFSNRLRKGENKRKILMAKYAKSVWRGQSTFKSHSNKYIADKSMLFIWFKREHSYFLMVRV